MGTKIPLAGGAPPNPLNTILARAQSLCGSTLTVPDGTDFGNTNEYINANASGGTSALSTVDRGGVVLGKTNTANFGQFVIARNSNSTPVAQIDNNKTSRFYVMWYAKLATAIAGTDKIQIELVASNGGNTVISIGANAAVSTTNWVLKLIDGGNNTIVNNTALAATLDTNWHTFEIWNDGTNLTIAIDQVQQYQTALTNLASGDPVYQLAVGQNGAAGVTNRQLNIDRMYCVTASN